MESFGERITRTIIEAEIEQNRCVVLRGLTDRLEDYLDEAERARLLAEVSEAMGEPVTDLFDAFLYLLPADRRVVVGWRKDEPAFKLEPWD